MLIKYLMQSLATVSSQLLFIHCMILLSAVLSWSRTQKGLHDNKKKL